MFDINPWMFPQDGMILIGSEFSGPSMNIVIFIIHLDKIILTSRAARQNDGVNSALFVVLID